MKDGKTSLALKILALCSAVGLGCTYVGWQQKQAAPHVEKAGERTVLSGSKNPGRLPLKYGLHKGEPDRTLMPSSKVGILPQPSNADSSELNQEPAAPNRTLLPGSKSIDAILRPRDVAPPAEPKAADP